MQLKYTFETRQERITVSYNPTHRHGHTNSWYVYVSHKIAYFNYLECISDIWYVYNSRFVCLIMIVYMQDIING